MVPSLGFELILKNTSFSFSYFRSKKKLHNPDKIRKLKLKESISLYKNKVPLVFDAESCLLFEVGLKGFEVLKLAKNGITISDIIKKINISKSDLIPFEEFITKIAIWGVIQS